MRVQVNYKYKNYPYAPSLTKKSQTIGKLTTPWGALVLGGLPAALLMESYYELAYFIASISIPLALILMPIIRKILFKKLDKKYAQMMSGKIPLK